MEYCGGGDLFEKIQTNPDGISEKHAADIMYQVFYAMSHCHEVGIVHRDLKPEHIMFVGSSVRVIDFGLSKRLKNKDDRLESTVGTPYFIAPEVLEGSYGLECDCWSMGVILYLALCGRLPFGGTNPAAIFAKVRQADFSFKKRYWRNVSKEAKDLITKLLRKDPA